MSGERAFCDATAGDPTVPFRCDLDAGHSGDRHRERWVASWLRDGTDVRWYGGGLVYPGGSIPTGQEASE